MERSKGPFFFVAHFDTPTILAPQKPPWGPWSSVAIQQPPWNQRPPSAGGCFFFEKGEEHGGFLF